MTAKKFFDKCVSLVILFALMGTLTGCSTQQNWISLFNGKNLDGWTPKIAGCEFGDNCADTFRVEDGILKISYDNYDKFDDRFGHIFYKDSFSHYILRAEYRFHGEQLTGGPGWGFRNSGLMLHCQDPKTMAKDQNFPICIEVQLLGGDGTNPRTTGNLCTPGTHVVMNDKIITDHCISSTSKTYHGDQWVTIEVQVRGNDSIKHIIDGKTILEYQQPQLDESDADAKKLLAAGAPLSVSEGYISLQAESHPLEFRKVQLLPLEK